jgi:undecaprenyl-diphosphatase
MTLLVAIILGLVQGLAEFIPVSSTGHLVIFEHLLSLDADNFHLFLEFINIGTLLALLIYYRKRIVQILRDIFQHKNYKLAINLVITALPVGIIGLLLAKFIESTSFFTSIITVAAAVGIIGLLMIFVEKLPKAKQIDSENDLTPLKALAIGFTQVLALIPGVSRSGSTILSGRLTGLSPKSAADYSFLVSIPIMTGLVLKTFLSSSDRDYFLENLDIMLVSNLVAFLAGLFAISFVLKFLARPNALKYFGIYRVLLSVLILIFLVWL